MSDELRWLIGIGVGLGGLIIAAFYRLAGQMATAVDVLHNRINKVREDYVRRDDYDKHVQRLETTLKEVRDEQRQMHQAVLQAIGKRDGGQQ